MRALTRRYLMASDRRRHGGCSHRSGPARPCAVRRLPLHEQPWRRALSAAAPHLGTRTSVAESASSVASTDPSLVQYRGRRVDRALWNRRIRADSVCGRSMAITSCLRFSRRNGRKSRKDAAWSTVSSPLRDQTISTRPGTDPSTRCSHGGRSRQIRKLAPGALEPHRREPDDRRQRQPPGLRCCAAQERPNSP
jgi:hypothetical protein